MGNMNRPVQTRILEELKGFPQGLSADALAIRLELDPAQARTELDSLYANSRVESRDHSVYRLIQRRADLRC